MVGASRTSSAKERCQPSSDYRPDLFITSPKDDATLWLDYTNELHIVIAVADYNGGSIARVDYFVNDILFGSTSTSPYDIRVRSIPRGYQVKLTAVAVDNTGNTRTSSPIPVQVSDPPSLIVSKGPGHTILMPTTSVFGPLSLEYSASGPSGPWHHLDGPYNPGGGSLGWSDGIDVTLNQRFYRLVLEQP